MSKQKCESVNTATSKIVTSYLCAMMLGLPLVMTNGFYNITQTKHIYGMIVSGLLLLAAVVSVCVTSCKTERLNKTVTPLDVTMGVFAAAVTVAACLSPYQADVWTGENSRYQGALTVLVYALVYVVVSRHYRSSQWVLLLMMAAFSVVSLFGVLNCFGVDFLGFFSSIAEDHKHTYISTIGNLNFYSAYMCLAFPVVIGGFCQTKGKTSQRIYLAAVVIGSLGMMVTSSESFVLGFAVSMAILPLFLFDDAAKLKKFFVALAMILLVAQVYVAAFRIADAPYIPISALLGVVTHPAVTAVLLAVCGGVYWLFCAKPQEIERYKKVYMVLLIGGTLGVIACFVLANTVGLGALDALFKITKSWGTYRGGIWAQCVSVYNEFSLKEKLFGMGPETTYHVLKALEIHGNNRLDQAHNEYLQYLLTTGLVGVLAYGSVIVSVIAAMCTKLKRNPMAVGLFAGLTAYWIQAAVNIAQPFTTPLMYVFIACIGGLLYNETNITVSAKTD